MARRRFNSQPYDSINLTPLIDTLFFLLIIFMVTAPLLEYTIDVSPPEMNADAIPKEEDKNAKTINLKLDGTAVFEGETMTRELCIGELIKISSNPEIKVFLRADRGLTYGSVIDFLAKVHNNGFKNIFLVTTEEAE